MLKTNENYAFLLCLFIKRPTMGKVYPKFSTILLILKILNFGSKSYEGDNSVIFKDFYKISKQSKTYIHPLSEVFYGSKPNSPSFYPKIALQMGSPVMEHPVYSDSELSPQSISQMHTNDYQNTSEKRGKL